MPKESKEKEVNTSKNNKKRNIIFLVAGLLLLVIILFLLWLFNRKFEVTFDYNNGTKEDIILVKYNKVIDSSNVKTKEDLGDQFIDWYLVLEEKDGEDILSEKPFDFTTKINKDTKLKALYEGVIETITITFDSKGGSSIEPITINKGSELNLPKAPTRNGYKFISWVDKQDRSISDNAKFDEDTTLYAKWEKEETKKETKETPKQETKKEESISLSLSNYYISMKGTNISKAIASYENVNGEITYSISSDTCVSINSKTGQITAKPDSGDKNSKACLSANRDIEVTATTPGGKSATQILHYEKRLTATAGGTMFYSGTKDNGFAHDRDGTFTITTNMDVTWSASGSYDKNYSTYNGTTYKGKMINQGNGNAFFTVTSKSGQKIEMFCQFYGN